jgi:LPS-assembly protein
VNRLPSPAARGLVALAAAGLLSTPALARGATASLPGPAGPVEVEAGTIRFDVATERFALEDGVRLRRGEVAVRARAATYDPRSGAVDATGGVLLTAPGRAVAADGIHAVLDGPWEARDVAIFAKGSPLDLNAAADAAAAEREGKNRLTLRADRVTGRAGGGGGPEPFAAEGVRLTLCDCADGAPSWEIRASRAEVTPGRSAILSWPVLYVTPRFLFVDTPVPVLPLPWLYVPLAPRQTGFLFPVVNVGSRGGWELWEPFFLTLGASWDATLTAGYAFGPPAGDVSSATAQGKDPGVRGVGGRLEVRWAPVEGVRGEARLHYLHDTIPYGWKPASGDRLGLLAENEARLGPGAFANARIALVGDAAYPQDFVGELLLRSSEYFRSAAAVGWASDHVLLEADLAYHEAIGTLGQPGVPVVPFGAFGGSIPSFHRLPAISATLLPLRLAGPLALSGQAGIARFAPISGITDRSVNGIGPGERLWSGPVPLPPGDAWTAGQRLSASRAWLRAELRAPVAVARVLELEPWVAGTAAAYAFGGAAQPALANGWVVGGAVASTRVERTFGSGPDALRHAIEPRAEWRGGTAVAGPGLPAYAYDEVDAAPVLPGAPCLSPPPGIAGGCLPLRSLSATIPGGFGQMRLALRNRLSAPGPSGSVTRLDLDLGQDLDVSSGRLGETWVRGAAAWGPVKGGLLARFLGFGASSAQGTWAPAFPGWLDRFTEVRLDVAAEDGRGDRLSLGFLALGSGASAALTAGTDPIFDPRAVPYQPFAQGRAGLKVRVLGGLDLGYDALFSARSIVTYPSGLGSPVVAAPGLQEQRFAASWTSPCDCWRGGVEVRLAENGYFGVTASLDLSEVRGIRLSP